MKIGQILFLYFSLGVSIPVFSKQNLCASDLSFLVKVEDFQIQEPRANLENEIEKVLEIFNVPFRNPGMAHIQRVKALENLASQLNAKGFKVRVIKNARDFAKIWQKRNPHFKSAFKNPSFLESFIEQYSSEMPLLEFGAKENKTFSALLQKNIPRKFVSTIQESKIGFYWSPLVNKTAGAMFFYDSCVKGFCFVSVSSKALKTLSTTLVEFHEFDHYWVHAFVNEGRETPFSWTFSSEFLGKMDNLNQGQSKSTLASHMVQNFGEPVANSKLLSEKLRLYLGNQGFDEIFTYTRDFLRLLALRLQNQGYVFSENPDPNDIYVVMALNARALNEVESALSKINKGPREFSLQQEFSDEFGNTFGVGEFKAEKGRKFQISVENIRQEGRPDSNLAVVTLIYNLSRPKKLTSVLDIESLGSGDSEKIITEALRKTQIHLYRTHEKLMQFSKDLLDLNLFEIQSRWKKFQQPQNIEFYREVYKKLSEALGRALEL